MHWTLQDVLTATRGDAAPQARRDLVFDAVTTDSRAVTPGALFVALRGVNHDAHDFVADALRNGAASAVVERTVAGVAAASLVRVSDTLKALGDLAAWTRSMHPLPVVAVTGSNGKTTTKEMIASICATAGAAGGVLKSEGNFNNLIGLPLTLLQLRGDETVAVLEMGMNHPGEIARLTEIARPNYAVITNVGLAHLEGVGGTLAGVAAAKGELFAGLRRDGAIAVNRDDPWVRRLAACFPGRTVTFGRDGEVRARSINGQAGDGIVFDLQIGAHTAPVQLRLIGHHNVMNALAAAAIGHAMGLSLATIAQGLERTVGPAMRMKTMHLVNGVTVINDTYNANPSSVEAALVALRRFPGRPVVVLGRCGSWATRAGALTSEWVSVPRLSACNSCFCWGAGRRGGGRRARGGYALGGDSRLRLACGGGGSGGGPMAAG